MVDHLLLLWAKALVAEMAFKQLERTVARLIDKRSGGLRRDVLHGDR
jgi:hypothetical protein